MAETAKKPENFKSILTEDMLKDIGGGFNINDYPCPNCHSSANVSVERTSLGACLWCNKCHISF